MDNRTDNPVADDAREQASKADIEHKTYRWIRFDRRGLEYKTLPKINGISFFAEVDITVVQHGNDDIEIHSFEIEDIEIVIFLDAPQPPYFFPMNKSELKNKNKDLFDGLVKWFRDRAIQVAKAANDDDWTTEMENDGI